MSAIALQPYLFYSGRCQEAIDFYQQALGAKTVFRMLFSESPDPVPPGMLQAGFENKIMHATIQIGQVTILVSDSCDDRPKFDGFRLALMFENADHATAAFNALAVDGKIEMPLTKTFWSPWFGMVTDKFNVGWMISVPGELPPT
ncbi:MAG: VOC family protein [Pirellulales bacterium]